MTSDTPKISLKNIHKSFGNNHVLKGIDLDVPAGKSVVIIGGSGSGKSITLKLIMGLMSPNQGNVSLDGQDIGDLSQKERDALMHRFGMLFQHGALFDSLPIWRNIAFGLIEGDGMAKKQAREVALEKLKAVGLEPEVADLYPAELSGGMQKRVSLARAIAGDPEIIFFDEPTTGLDPIMADVINNLIVKCVKDIGATALSITHDMASVRKIADYVAFLYKGKIIWFGDVKELDKTDDPYVQQFIHGRAEGPITDIPTS